MFYLKALKHFHSGNLKGLSVDWKVGYPTLESAINASKTLLKHTTKPMKDLQGKKVTFHVIRIERE